MASFASLQTAISLFLGWSAGGLLILRYLRWGDRGDKFREGGAGVYG